MTRAVAGEVQCGDCEYRPATAIERDTLGNQVDACCSICLLRRGPRVSVVSGGDQVVIGGVARTLHRGIYNQALG